MYSGYREIAHFGKKKLTFKLKANVFHIALFQMYYSKMKMRVNSSVNRE